MSTEQKPAANQPHHAATEPKHEPNALASGLTTGWEKFKQGQLISYPMMAVILVVIAATGFGLWLYFERSGTASAKWVDWDGLISPAEMEQFAEKNPGTIQAKLAKLEIARRQLGEEGIGRLTASDPIARKTAIESIEKAREAFANLVDEFKDDPVLKVECMVACAKAEAVLVGLPKDGQLEQFRGDPAKAVEWLDKVAEAAPETPWGKDAKKLADTLRNQNTQQQVVTLQASVYVMPTLPAFDPKMPRDPIHGFPEP